MSSVTNSNFRELLGVSYATTSRWRSGDRLPELSNMATISNLLDWSLDEQYAARENGTYANELQSRVAARYPGDPMGQETSKNQQVGPE